MDMHELEFLQTRIIMLTIHWVSMNFNLYKTMIIILTIHWVVLNLNSYKKG